MLAAVLVVVASPVPASRSAEAAVTSAVVAAQADARVEKNAPTTNFGASSTLDADASPVVETYLRFAVGAVAGTVTKAVVRLSVTNGSADGPAVFPTSSTWTESGITWNTRPSRTGAALADVGAVAAGAWVEYDVTGAVSGAGSYGFVVVATSTDGTTFRSRQSTSTQLRPQLVLTVQNDAPADTVPPETAVTSGPSGTVWDRSATIAFASSEPDSTFSCQIDTSAPAPCLSPMHYTGLADGPHTFAVRAHDASGNIDPSPAERSWTVDAISPTVETTPVPHTGDAADDAAVWVNPIDPALSAVIATDKQGGLAVYDLAGRQLQYLAVGGVNNVDVRSAAEPGRSFSLGGAPVSLVTVGNRSTNSIGLYEMVSETRQLRDVAARVITPGLTVYGSCLYRSPETGAFFVFVDSKSGVVEQWHLYDNGAGRVDGRRVRSFDVGTQVEGCVADDDLGHLYISEEAVGIWKYGADPGDGTARTLVGATSSTGPLFADVEGLTLAHGPDGTGQLIASSQGSSSFAVYDRRPGNAYLRSFRVDAGNGIDGAEETDGIDVSTASLGPAFPSGVFVAQDGRNSGGNQNFKLVPYQELSPPGGP